MIKKIILTGSALIFAFLILGVSIFKTSASDSVSAFSSLNGPTIKKNEVDYSLPYPGILPGHPLYFLKMIRDRIQLFLTTDRLKRAEKLLHFADKRINAAHILVQDNQSELGITTAAKAEKYLERAINQERKAREKGQETRLFLERLEKACLKHEEILLEIKEKKEGSEEPIDELLNYPRQGIKKVKERLNK